MARCVFSYLSTRTIAQKAARKHQTFWNPVPHSIVRAKSLSRLKFSNFNIGLTITLYLDARISTVNVREQWILFHSLLKCNTLVIHAVKQILRGVANSRDKNKTKKSGIRMTVTRFSWSSILTLRTYKKRIKWQKFKESENFRLES